MHKLARLTPLGRRRTVQRLAAGARVRDVAAAIDLSTTTVRRWWRRYQAEGEAGLADRSSRPHRSPRALPRHRRGGVMQAAFGGAFGDAVETEFVAGRMNTAQALTLIGTEAWAEQVAEPPWVAAADQTAAPHYSSPPANQSSAWVAREGWGYQPQPGCFYCASQNRAPDGAYGVDGRGQGDWGFMPALPRNPWSPGDDNWGQPGRPIPICLPDGPYHKCPSGGNGG